MRSQLGKCLRGKVHGARKACLVEGSVEAALEKMVIKLRSDAKTLQLGEEETS